jgi:hypothetical protein
MDGTFFAVSSPRSNGLDWYPRYPLNSPIRSLEMCSFALCNRIAERFSAQEVGNGHINVRKPCAKPRFSKSESASRGSKAPARGDEERGKEIFDA